MIHPLRKPWNLKKKNFFFKVYSLLLIKMNFSFFIFFINFNKINFQFYKNIFIFIDILLLYRYTLNPNKYITIIRSKSPFYWSLRIRRNVKMLSFVKRKKYFLYYSIKHKESQFLHKKYANIKLLIKMKKYYSLLKRRNSILRFVITVCRRDKKKDFLYKAKKVSLKKDLLILRKNPKMIFFLKNIFNLKKNKNFRRPFFFKKFFRKSLYENRLIWKFFFFLKFKRNFFLKKFISQTLTSLPVQWFTSYEFSLLNIILRSRFCLTRQQTDNFIKMGHVYVNGKSTQLPCYITKPNDIIQILYKISFFMNWKYTYSILMKSSFRLGYCLWRLYRNRGNFFKQKSHHVPSWINKLMFFKLNTPKYMEVDYSALSLILLRYPVNLFEFTVYTAKYFNLFLFRLYNWKYVI